MIVLVQMGLGILTTQSSFEIASLTQQQRDLTYQKQILYDETAGLSSPQYLAANAAALGMVIDESPTYLRLSDGAVIGSDKPATPPRRWMPRPGLGEQLADRRCAARDRPGRLDHRTRRTGRLGDPVRGRRRRPRRSLATRRRPRARDRIGDTPAISDGLPHPRHDKRMTTAASRSPRRRTVIASPSS